MSREIILKMAGRFGTVTDNDLQELLIDKDSKNTQRSTKAAFKVFTSYLAEKNINFNIYSIKSAELNEILKRFYVEIRKKDGTLYSKSLYHYSIQKSIVFFRGQSLTHQMMVPGLMPKCLV